MVLSKLTRDYVRKMQIGKLEMLSFVTAKAADSARVTFHQMKVVEGMEFERKRSADPKVIIIRRIK